MLTVKEIRQKFLEFFQNRQHKIVAAAPIVNQNDPTLMFVNSGMAQFKDSFLGNQTPPAPRVADTQKCLRVSGKHNDLEDVGMDGTHHTMFEMLGNWSFGDYFKKEALQWSWELLTETYQIPKDRLYATVFEGDAKENLASDEEARQIWLQYLPANHIINGNKKDNFWEMGDVGPCGPCSEIHVDLRSDADRAAIAGETLVNKDHPQVVEIWNNVFMQFERYWNTEKGGNAALVEWERNYAGSRDADTYKKGRAAKHAETTALKELSAKHVDTGMGLERLCMVLQGVQYTYDTDAFRPLIAFLEQYSGIAYKGIYDRFNQVAKSDIAMRVIADHVRAVALIIADGQLPSSTGAGYVLRRILRRAVRYYYSFLNIQEPVIYLLIPILADMFDGVFPEVKAQQAFITSVIQNEEISFLRTLSTGLRRLDELALRSSNTVLQGSLAFELYDTFGFPFDLTKLILSEKGMSADEKGFEKALAEQKLRSKQDAQKEAGNWVELIPNFNNFEFVGYDQSETLSEVVKYRIVKNKKGTEYQLALDITPFYPEGGGQVGDTGYLQIAGAQLQIADTKKENQLVLHIAHQLPEGWNEENLAEKLEGKAKACINTQQRNLTINNHTATHLLQSALRQVLGTHIAQKGSLVNAEGLRFDFSHFQKVSDAEIAQIEQIVNTKIRQNIALREQRSVPIEEAQKSGAMMLFGEKYGETVRIITFDESYSKELCGGCHVQQTGQIGLFKIISEGSTQAGVRRVEAITSVAAENWVRAQETQLGSIKNLFKNPADVVKSVQELQDANKTLQKEIERLQLVQAHYLKHELLQKAKHIAGLKVVLEKVDITNKDATKQLCSEIHQLAPESIVVLACEEAGKATLTVSIPRELVEARQIDAIKIIKHIASEIQGGGGGQNFYATAGGKNPAGIGAALDKAKEYILAL